MYPGNYHLEWHKFKDGEPMEEAPKVGSVARAWQWRERGINPRNQPHNKTVLENIAEDILVQKPLQITSCELPGFPRSTFLMVFSPDGTKLASTHGNHNIYVSELSNGKHVRILKGHPRTPWCIAFHPSHPRLIGSGCLGGQVRIWDISSGGSEVWNVYNETVIASLAFHPREQLLVIATHNELYFWNWSQPAPLTKVSTRNINEKVRYVAFDSLGFKLITGVSLWASPTNASTPLTTPQNGSPSNSSRGNGSPGNGNPGNGGPGNGNNPGDGQPRLIAGPDRPQSPDTPPFPPQDLIVNSYHNLVQRYDSLVRNYQRLFMVRHRLINTPPLANSIDRGTDPMESYPPFSLRLMRRSERGHFPSTETGDTTTNPANAASQQQDPPVNNTAAPTPRSGFISLRDSALSNSTATRNTPGVGTSGFRDPIPGLRHIGFASAFQPLGDERIARLTPTYSSTNSERQPNSSRTSGLFAQRIPVSERIRRTLEELRPLTPEARDIEFERAGTNSSTTEGIPTVTTLRSLRNFLERGTPLNEPTAGPPHGSQPPLPTEPPPANPPPPPGPAPDASRTSTLNYASHLDEALDPTEEAQTINESLDLIRDILRDSGTRLLNLITNMSMNILSNSERNASARRDLLASSSGSDSDTEYPEVNITRTLNSTFRGWDELTELNRISGTNAANNRPRRNSIGPQFSLEIRPESETPSRQGGINVSNRMTFELDDTSELPSREGGINVSLSDDRFRVRSHGSWAVNSSQQNSQENTPAPVCSAPAATAEPKPGPSREAAPAPAPRAPRDEPQPGPSSAPDAPDPNQPSTSRGNTRPRNSDISAQAFRRVKMGVFTLQKHTMTLANMWLRGDRTSLRELRALWEALRRRILALPTLYNNRSLLERCMLLSELTVMPELPARPRPAAPGRQPSRRSRMQNRARSEETIRMRYERDRNPNEAENGLGRSNPRGRNSKSKTNTSTTSNSNTPGSSNTTTAGTSHSNTPDTSSSNKRSNSNRTAAGTLNLNTPHTSNSNTPSNSNTTTPGSLNSNTPKTSNSNTSSTNNPSTSSNAVAGPSTSGNAVAGPSTSTENTNDNRNSRAARAQRINRKRVRLQQAYRWQGEDEARRRDIYLPFRLSLLRPRSRTNFMRTLEQNATRHVIRTRAMKILSVMFNMMMMCLEERGLNHLIINMLKTLKKALALTCFMMMSNRNMPRDRARDEPTAQSVESADVVRIQNVDHSEPINVDDNGDDPQSLRPNRADATADESQPPVRTPTAVTSGTQTENSYPIEPLPSPETSPTADSGMEWSHRLAVQIAAANRNTSSTAKTRRDLYLETRRQKALHRTNPIAHPFVRRRFPPVRSHRIPAMRTLPPELLYNRVRSRSPPPDPVAGPSNALPRSRTENTLTGREARDNFFRLAHIRLRTAARNRFRRLQTIRLYTPSSVREMFALQDFQGENRPEEAPADDAEGLFGLRRAQFSAMLASEGLLQVNDPPAAEANANPRLPRIHEYLQPIILAQNAMVVDDEENAGGGGPPPAGVHGSRRPLGTMAGLLDAGIISETLPPPSHRLQAWDFTSGAAPDIADSTKNVVVQPCRIHNDASIDISKDGRLLVALLPAPRSRNSNNWLTDCHVGVYCLEWPRLGQCLHTAVLEQSAVSVALSPTARYLAVGLGLRRFTSSSQSRSNIIALLYKLDPLVSESTSHSPLSPMKELEQYWEHGFTSLNCLRWAPQPGQGLVYANNTGQLIIMT